MSIDFCKTKLTTSSLWHSNYMYHYLIRMIYEVTHMTESPLLSPTRDFLTHPYDAHRNEKVVRMTALIFTGDVEDKLQRLQWIPRLSTWRPFRFCVTNVAISHGRFYEHIVVISYGWLTKSSVWYSISQEICTRFCCALLCCGYAIVHNEFTRSIYPYSSGLLCWHWGNR